MDFLTMSKNGFTSLSKRSAKTKVTNKMIAKTETKKVIQKRSSKIFKIMLKVEN